MERRNKQGSYLPTLECMGIYLSDFDATKPMVPNTWIACWVTLVLNSSFSCSDERPLTWSTCQYLEPRWKGRKGRSFSFLLVCSLLRYWGAYIWREKEVCWRVGEKRGEMNLAVTIWLAIESHLVKGQIHENKAQVLSLALYWTCCIISDHFPNYLVVLSSARIYWLSPKWYRRVQ